MFVACGELTRVKRIHLYGGGLIFMQKIIGDVYHTLGSIKNKIGELVDDEKDELKKSKLKDLSDDVQEMRTLIATNLTNKEES
jgi:hypothetical protein